MDYPPGFLLDQAIGVALNQDWTYDFADPYDAMEAWFHGNCTSARNSEALVRDIDLLFSTTESAEERFARWRGTGLRVDEIDAFLAAMRKRAVDGLAGDPEPMRQP